MNYRQTIEYLYAQLPMFSRIGDAAYKKDLHNTISLCKALNDPQNNFKSVHVAGTNGKGSTSHMLAAILQTAGYKTGLYTSPHLHDFRERIKINGEMVREDFVVDFVDKTMELSKEVSPSFFELTVAMAFDYFSREHIDIAIIETGLGGRLDSTNIISPVLSVITNIGYDHMNILGDTIEEIASEKAGIIKDNTPVVIGEYNKITRPIFISRAEKCNAPIHFAQEEYEVSNINANNHFLQCDVMNLRRRYSESFVLDLIGLYQATNLCTVLSAKEILIEKGFSIKNETAKSAIANVKGLTGLYGRWEVISEHPTVVLDVAHNEDGIKKVLQNIKAGYEYSSVHFVMGMVKDKDIEKVLSLLPATASYYFSGAHIPRSLTAGELKERALKFGLTGESFDNVNEAIESAKRHAKENDIIIVCGSIFLVGEVASPHLA